ncbi:MAG: M48 family metallopeptidase [Planctomycetota bacterium]
MWEAIRSNTRRSRMLIGLMGVILLGLGAVIGLALVPPAGDYFASSERGAGLDPVFTGLCGAGVAFVIWLIMWAVAAGSGDSVLLSAAGAREIQKAHAPQLWNVVEEMTIASSLGKMPKVYIIDDEQPNAFAVGYKPSRAAIAVTAGLLRRLNRDELQGVIAHEIGHIRNLDVKFMTTAGVMVGAIVIISDIFLRSMWYGAGRRRSSSRGGGQAQLILMVVAILAAILAPIFAQLLYYACSRKREYLADASAARFTRYPEGLASALEIISKRTGRGAADEKKINRVVAPMYIVNPLQARAATSAFATHPPTDKRVKILRSMGGQAGFAEYEAAYRQATGGRSACIGAHTLATAEGVEARQASAEPKGKKQAVERAREVGDLLAGMADFLFITCACGVRMKVPPDCKHKKLNCPRCGTEHEIPEAAIIAPMLGSAVRDALPGKQIKSAVKAARQQKKMRYKRKGDGWESFKCACGHTVQLSPAFDAPSIHCGKCNREIEIA